MPKDIRREDLRFDDTVKVNNRGEAILGRLYGPVAEFIAPTRNGRMYDEDTWDKVFKKPLVVEMFEAGGLLGELNHPEDRLETDLSKVCVCMPEVPKKDKSGVLTAYFDILDTPNGRIVQTLAKYGYKLGCSSRADGDLVEGYDGMDHVNPDTFDLKGFDIVLLPSVKKARLSLAESLQKDLKKALKEQLDSASADDRKIMLESLKSLDINIQEDRPNEVAKDKAAVDDRAKIIEQLQESLKSNRTLEAQVTELQEKLSVCYAKEAKLEEELTRYKHSIITLSEGVKAARGLKEKYDSLKESLSQKESLIKDKEQTIARLSDLAKASVSSKKALKEHLTSKDSSIKKLEEDLQQVKTTAEKEKQDLLESIADLKKDSELKSKQYSTKMEKANKLVEHYRSIAKSAVEKYIASKATMYGVTPQEIKNRLSESYSFADIDKVCEDLRGYKLNLSRLPFDITHGKKVKVQESIEPIKPKIDGIDDEVDDSLLSLANLK